MKLMDFKNNHVYIGSEDRVSEWAGLKDGDAPVDGNQIKLITQVREKIKNYLEGKGINIEVFDNFTDREEGDINA